MAWYDSVAEAHPHDKDIAFLDARCHYMNGVGYYETDSVVAACAEYLKALEIMETHFEEKDLVGYKAKFMALTNTRLVDVFSNQYLSEQAIYYGKQALAYFQRCNTEPWYIAWLLEETGMHYDILGEFEKAKLFYQIGEEILIDTNTLSYRDLCAHLAYLSYKMGGALDHSLGQLRKILLQAEDEKESISRIQIIGDIFYRESMMDSAVVYLEKVYQGQSNQDSKLLSAQRLQEICLLKGDSLHANEYAMYCSQYFITKDHFGELNSELMGLGHFYRQKKEEKEHLLQMRKMMIWGVLILGMLFLATMMVAQNRKRQKWLSTQRESLLSATLEKAQETTERLLQENEVLNDQLKLKNKEQVLPRKTKKDYSVLVNEPICVNIKQRLNKAKRISSFDVKNYTSLALSSKELCELAEIIEKHCNGFSRQLKGLYPELSVNDLKLCRFYVLDLTVLQVAILLHTDYSSIRKRTNRLKAKLGCEDIHQQMKSFFFEL